MASAFSVAGSRAAAPQSLFWPASLSDEPLREQARRWRDPAGVTKVSDQEYARVGNKRLLLDLYLPERATGLLPIVVSIHGGGWVSGSKEAAPGIGLSVHGCAVACISYRLSSEAVFPAQLEDCKAAIRWLRANRRIFNLAADRIGVIGHSAGGHLASLLGVCGEVAEFEQGEHLELSSRVQAVCALSGPTDLLQMDAHALPTAPFKHDAPESPESRLIGGPIQENKDRVARANPITYISKSAAPFLLVHGDCDPLVPSHQAELLQAALESAGVPSTLRVIPGAGHRVEGPEVERLVEEFFRRHMKADAGQLPAATKG